MSEERRAPISNTRGSAGSREGGQNRNNGNNRNRNRNNNNRRGGQGGQGGGGNRQGGRRLDPDREVKRTRKKPAPLTMWQKFLSIFGLYKPASTKAPARGGAGNKSQSKNAGRPAREAGGGPRQARDGGRRGQGGGEGGGAQRKRAPRKLAPSDPSKVEGTRLYIGNLSYETTEYELEELLKGVGKVRKIEVVYNRRTHKSKGYAFVEMQNVEEAKRAVEVLHDQPFMGRQMIVNGAKSKGAYEEDSASQNTEQSASQEPAKEPVKEVSTPLVPREPEQEAAAPAAEATSEKTEEVSS